MKKTIAILTASALSLLFTACGDQKKADFVGYWHESESDIIYEVIKNENQYTIRTINGDLSAEVNKEGKLCGVNSWKMSYCMTMKGNDSAYYDFADFTIGYERISKDQYEKLLATKKKATFTAPEPEQQPAEQAQQPAAPSAQ